EKAMEIVEAKGYGGLSMRSLAKELDIRASSLYNHIQSTDDLKAEISMRIVDEFFTAQTQAMAGKDPEAAIMALAHTYRRLAKEKQNVYDIAISLPIAEDAALYEKRKTFYYITMQALEKFALTDEQRVYWQRFIRATLHGFVSLEMAGYFDKNIMDLENSYSFIIDNIIKGLRQAEQENK
ncbi:MAG: TetR/AcrR family transcriptional regulator, partial [Phascolarctobacterium sp.]